MILRQKLLRENNEYKEWMFNLLDKEEISIIANAIIYEYDNFVEIKYINVSREYRGNGIGTMLLLKILSRFNQKNIYVETFSERIRWYSKFGFRILNSKNGIFRIVRERD
ncbi:MAG: GNAT family N-acetyltransferase [Candidatus Asgardarchaeia archaeon]